MPKGRLSGLWFIIACCLLLPVLPVRAQDTADAATRDPHSLARRLLGWNGETSLPDITPLYEPGDTLEFWVGKLDSGEPTRIRATLAAAAPSVYVWVEEGLDYNAASMQQTALALDNLLKAVRWRGTYLSPNRMPATQGRVLDPANLYSLPDVDGDPHVYIVYTSDLPDDRDAIYNPIDSLPSYLAPGPHSNGHETLFVNTSPYVGTPLSDSVFIGTLLRAFHSLIVDTHYPDQPLWLREALGWYLLLQFQQTPITPTEVANFLGEPSTMLLHPATLTTRSTARGMQLLFLAYLEQRYGVDVVRRLFLEQGPGMTAVDRALAAANIVDPLSGETVTGEMAFADFVLANAVNRPFGDGRYAYRLIQLNQQAVSTPLERPEVRLGAQPAPQFGTQYYTFDAARPLVLDITFNGVETVKRLDMPGAADADNAFYWSGRGGNRDATLTRAFDLREVDSATLHFDAWYDLASGWNYAYVEVSTDGGETWSIIPATDTTDMNRNGVAYGPGFTGISNREGPRPFPVMGVLMAGDGMTIASVVPDGPAEAAGLQAGDIIIGYDERPWPGMPNVLGLLGEYAPGETLNLWIQRGNERLTAPVLLGAHESRVVEPTPRWLEQEVDLSAYAGQEILLRFEVVTLPGRWSEGFAVDNIAIPEIGFADDGDDEAGWVSTGWEQVTNSVPARYLVQMATFGGARPERARRLLTPDDGTSGHWRVDLDANERLVIAVSGLNQDTFQPGQFDLQIMPVG